MEKEILNIEANGVNFHCEMRGNGPLVVLVPDGWNDCGPMDNLAVELSEKYTTLTFDMRGGSRSKDNNPSTITPAVLGDDVAELIRKVNRGKATIYGCSSGGQAVLAAGKRHPELIKNIIVHEGALQANAPIEGSGYSYFKNVTTFDSHLDDGLDSMDFWSVGNADVALALGQETRSRVASNKEFWGKWYLGSVDLDIYTKEDFDKMPPVDFTVGAWSPSWLVYANIDAAKTAGTSVTWFDCAHHPELILAKEYAEYMEKIINKY